MQPINIPFKNRNFIYKVIDNQQCIWDVVRRKYIIITPEEMVRQHVLWCLIEDFGYPLFRINMEKWITVGKMRKRFDILVYDENIEPYLLVETKAPNVPLDLNTIKQIASYHYVLKNKYGMISNGALTFIYESTPNGVVWLESMPNY